MLEESKQRERELTNPYICTTAKLPERARKRAKYIEIVSVNSVSMMLHNMSVNQS